MTVPSGPDDGAEKGRGHADLEDREPGGAGVAAQAEDEAEHGAEDPEDDRAHDGEAEGSGGARHGLSH